jgi:thymidylate synthase
MQYLKNNLHQALKGSDTKIDWENIPTRAISLMYNARSQDVPLGTPFNIASYALLLEIIGKIVNMVPDELITNMGDCHIYLNQIDGINEQLKREPFELPTLRINTEFWPTESGECGVGSLVDNVDWLIRGMEINDFQIENYKYHPSIKIPLSN